MADLIKLTAAEIAAKIAAGEVTAVEVTEAHLARIEAVDEKVHAFLHVDREGALAQARAVDEKRARGEKLGPLAGVPLALKDIFTTEGIPTTVGSKILEGWIPPYDATLTKQLKAADVVILGKTNMDEFAMGSSTENSAYGPTGNPWDLTKIPGGSGGGSSRRARLLRGPARHRHGHRRLHPPARRRHRHGRRQAHLRRRLPLRHGRLLLLPRPGRALRPYGPGRGAAARGHRRPRPAGLHLHRRAGPGRSSRRPATAASQGMRVGVVKQFRGEGYQAGVIQRFDESVELLKELGAEIVELDCPSFDLALSAYYLIAPSECSSNLARFDAMRYGLRVGDDGTKSAEDVTALTREAGFGDEVKRRIMLGTYALSSGYYDAYYGSAQKVRTLITRDFEKAFEQVDVIVSPTTPTTAFPIGERADDPMAMYLADLCTIPTNLAGNAAMSLPCGLAPEDGLPVGLQIIAPAMADDRLYQVGAAVEAAFTAKWGHPLLEEAPSL